MERLFGDRVMLDIKTLIKNEWKFDEPNAQITFWDTNKKKKKFVKVPEIEFDRGLLQLDILDVLKRMKKEEWVDNERFNSIYEIALIMMGENEGWEVINSFCYRIKGENDE